MGSLMHYLRTASPERFQPMNANLGLFPPLEGRIRDKALRAAAQRERALEAMRGFWAGLD